jgi:hypothetical protein
LPKRFIIRNWIAILIIIVNVRYHVAIIIKILVMDRLVPTPTAGSRMRSRKCAGASCHDVSIWQVISLEKFKK